MVTPRHIPHKGKETIGREVEVKKLECVGHVQKRMGNRLLALKKTKVTDDSGRRGGGGGGGRNHLTKNTILLLQKYYGKVIRSHVNNVEGMKGAVWAVFYHSLSTDDNPQHQFCPTGERS